MNSDAVSTRRRFFYKAGAALSVPLAVGATAAAADEAGSDASMKARLAELEAINGIRALQQQLAQYINNRAVDRAVDLFVDADYVEILAGVCHLAGADFGEQDIVELSGDGRTARAESHCMVETEIPIEGNSTVAEMARLQGNGAVRRSEARVLEADFIKRQDAWTIRRLNFRRA